ncbi:hypothetical protein B6U74_04275 [Candidatus Bathyarchaeota archaeon ex4484_205]|nr:MAG: hypothetical protein B6U74_04275 [Candidatus Bathyarchaeota archaeon ex4484_205]
MSVKIGFIGCGGIARSHLSRLSKMPEVSLSLFYDINPSISKEVSKLYGGNTVESINSFLSSNIDAVYICVPPFAHGFEKKLAEKEIPMFIEKPVSNDIALAREILKSIESKDIITSIGYLSRYLKITDELKDMLKEMGREFIQGYGHHATDMRGYNKSWLFKQNLSGGILVEFATHILDIVRYLVGDPEEVYAKTSDLSMKGIPEKEGVLSDASVILGYNKSFFTVLTTWGTQRGLGEYTLTFLLPDKVLKWDFLKRRLEIIRGDQKDVVSDDTDPMETEDRIFIDAVKRADPRSIRSTYKDALLTLKLSLLAYKSSSLKRAVKWTEEP